MHSVQSIRLQVEHALLLFSVVHCTIQNLLTFLGKEGELDLFIHRHLLLKLCCFCLFIPTLYSLIKVCKHSKFQQIVL